MTASPLFSVVIPVWNKWELTEKCLRGLAETSLEYAFEVIVVDNGSTDATVTELEPLGAVLFGRCFTRIRFEENRNFGPACNAGARAAVAPLLFFLNNDTLPTAGWAPPLVNALEKEPGLAAVGPLLLYPDDTVQHLGVAFSLFSMEHLYRGFPRDHAVVGKTRFFQALTAAALMLPRQSFHDAGGFCEDYRNGYEDVDLCLQLGRRTGKRLSCIPQSVIYHYESQTPGRKEEEKRNSLLLAERCADLCVPDRHNHGLRDGFLPFVNDTLDISLRLTDRDEAALDNAAEGKEFAEIFGLVRLHQFWVGGRRKLAAALEAQGYVEQALFLYSQVVEILPLVEEASSLMQAAVRLRDASLLDTAQTLFRKMKTSGQDRARLQQLFRQARKYDDPYLETLYGNKFQALFP